MITYNTGFFLCNIIKLFLKSNSLENVIVILTWLIVLSQMLLKLVFRMQQFISVFKS